MCIFFRVSWDFIDKDGTKNAITRSFYKAPNSEYAEEHFNAGHFVFQYNSTVAVNVFPLDINGMLLEWVRFMTIQLLLVFKALFHLGRD